MIADGTPPELVARSRIAKELDVSTRTICRWESEGRPGFDRPVKIGHQVFHPRDRIEAVKVLGNQLQALPLDAKA
jgi:DNA-binding transcriptional MerR regulator